jgi:hypothetical protein
MSESRITEIAERWKDIAAAAQCEEWWYSAIRHCQRNVDDLCPHESWGMETDQPDIHPGRYEGTVYAHAAEDIHYLLAVLSDKEEE